MSVRGRSFRSGPAAAYQEAFCVRVWSRPMLRFALTRILMAIPTLLIVSLSVFFLIRLIPGDPASLMLGDMADPAAVAELHRRLGLDRSVVVQFAIWFGN